MRVGQPGIEYQVAHLESQGYDVLFFRSGGYGSPLEAVQEQEILRVLIDRTRFLNGIIPANETGDAIYYLETALAQFGCRHCPPMRIIEPGHVYGLFRGPVREGEVLRFIRRSSAAVDYGNGEHAGTNTQEVIRVLIDRLGFLRGRVRWIDLSEVIYSLRMALFCYEARAWARKQQQTNRQAGQHDLGKERYRDVPFTEDDIELRPVGPDGHILLSEEEADDLVLEIRV
jgi:hypothetical protein